MNRDRPAWPGLGLHTWTLWALAAAPLLDLLRRFPEFLIAHDMGGRRLALLLVVLLVLLPLPWVVLAHVLRRRAAWPPILLLPPLVLIGLGLAVRNALGVAALPLALGLALVALWGYLKLPPLRRYCSWLAPVALVAPVMLLADGTILKLWLPPAVPVVGATRGAGVPGAPVVVLVLDELPITTLLDDAGTLDRRRFPNLAALADEAHWFDNVVSEDSSTPKAIAALLTGRRLGSKQLPIARDLPHNLFTLLGPTYRIASFEPVTRICPLELNTLGGTAQDRADWLRDTWIVAQHLVVPEPFASGLPSIDAQWTGFGDPEAEPGPSEPTEPTGQPDPPNWKTIWKRAGREVRRDRLEGFERLLDAIDDRQRGALYFAHLLLPHRPWFYFPTGSTFRPKGYTDQKVFQEKAWPPSPSYAASAYQRHLLQAEFVDVLIGRLVERLRERGIYDSTLLAITADHGICFLPGEMKRKVTAASRTAILQVPLLLKLPGQREGRYHPEPRSTLDLLPTVLAALDVEPPTSVTGRPLLDRGFPESGGESGPGPEAPWRADLAHRAEVFGPLDQPAAPYAIGQFADWFGRELAELELRRDDSYQLELAAPGFRFEHVAGAQPVPAWVYGRLTGPDPKRRLGLAIAIDGTVWATTEYDPADRTGFFKALLPESVVSDGAHELTVVVIDPATGRAVLPGSG